MPRLVLLVAVTVLSSACNPRVHEFRDDQCHDFPVLGTPTEEELLEYGIVVERQDGPCPSEFGVRCDIGEYYSSTGWRVFVVDEDDCY